MYVYLYNILKNKMPKRNLLFYILTVFVIEVAGGRKGGGGGCYGKHQTQAPGCDALATHA